MSILTQIIPACSYVSEYSRFVKINENKLKLFAKSITNVQMSHWLASSPFGLLDLPVETIINFLPFFEALDFSFWGEPKWKINTSGRVLDGSMALLYVLLEYVKHNGVNFYNLTKSEFSRLINQDIEIPLFDERYNNIHAISTTINNELNGDFYQHVKNISDGNELFELVVKLFPCLKDERTYNGRTVPFYKLAQLLVSDILHIREAKEQIKINCHALTGCSDYKIPQVLRGLGILEYDSELAQLVDTRQELAINSKYEVEIRANTITAIDQIYHALSGRYDHIAINDYLYDMKSCQDLKLWPYHLTRCTNY